MIIAAISASTHVSTANLLKFAHLYLATNILLSVLILLSVFKK
jgi:hypothetical protein